MAERASFAELLAFANKVREAGGGNPLDALMPAVPEDASQCLIAKNLNFNCRVHSGPSRDDEILEGAYDPREPWCMVTDDKDLRDRIAAALDLPILTWSDELMHSAPRKTHYAVILPDNIGQIAAEFDAWSSVLWWDDEKVWHLAEDADAEEKQRIKDFWPYIDASVKEAYANASFVNEKGEIVL